VAQLNEKIKRIRRNLNYTTARVVLERFPILLLPPLQVAQMVRRIQSEGPRKLHRTVVRRLLQAREYVVLTHLQSAQQRNSKVWESGVPDQQRRAEVAPRPRWCDRRAVPLDSEAGAVFRLKNRAQAEFTPAKSACDLNN